MKRAFILLEAVIALLLLSAACIFALDGMRMMNASVARFKGTYEVTRARKNALALTRHLARTEKLEGGAIEYGGYVVRWRASVPRLITIKLPTLTGEETRRLTVYSVAVETLKDGNVADKYETIVATPSAR